MFLFQWQDLRNCIKKQKTMRFDELGQKIQVIIYESHSI